MSHAMQLEKLNGENYSTWVLQMKSCLITQDLWKPVVTECPASGQERDRWLSDDEKALATITLCVRPSELLNIKDCKTAKDAWTALSELYNACGPARKVNLFKRLVRFKFHSSEKFAPQINEFCSIAENLREIAVTVPSDLLSILLLCSLPDDLESFVIAIESRDKLPTLDNLKSKILEEEQRRGDKYEPNSEKVLAMNSKNGVRGNKKPQYSQQQQQRSRGADKQNNKVKCYECGRRGHIRAECRRRKDQPAPVALSVVNLQSKTDQKVWILDSGASSHMCPHKSFFNKLSKHSQKVYLATGEEVSATGIGTIKLKSSFTELILNKVLYIPDLQANIISLSKVIKNGNKVYFNETKTEVKSKDNRTVFAAKEDNGVFYTYLEKPNSNNNKEQLMTMKESELKLWHQRFGHLNCTDLLNLSKREMVRGLEFRSEIISENINCNTCALCKISRKPFPNYSSVSSSKLLEIIHSDICGPMRVPSQGGAKYFITFIDDFSRYVYVDFLKRKSDAFNAFKTFLNQVERQTGNKIKKLRSDNGLEYVNSNFKNFLDSNGIVHETTVSYTPQQNGTAERSNRTLVEMARCLLEMSTLPQYLWAEAVNTAAYIRNRSCTKILKNKTPFECWVGKKPSVKHFKVFGCEAVVLDKRNKKSKFEPKGVKMVFVGYASNTKGYRLFDLKERKIVIARDVLFFEETFDKTENEYKIETERKEGEQYEIDFGMKEENKSGEEAKETELEDNFLSASSDDNDHDYDDIETIANRVVARKEQNRSISGRFGESKRVMGHKNRYLHAVVEKPNSVKEAHESPQNREWKNAMQTEYNALTKNNTWSLVTCPENKNVIGSKWVFTTKHNADGTIDRYKARLVAQGCTQVAGIDYTDTFAPVVRHSTIRLILSLAVQCKLLVNHVDVVSAYLNGDLEEEVYMRQPEGFIDKNFPKKVCKLNKSLYGLKQAGRNWNTKVNSILCEIGFKRCKVDNCVYTLMTDKEINIISVYVDDIILACSSAETLQHIIKKLQSHVEAVDKGPLRYYLGMEICRDGQRGSISICQHRYVTEMLKKWNMDECKGASTPFASGTVLDKCLDPDCLGYETKNYQSLVGGLTYLATVSRPDIAYTVSKLAQFHGHPHREHMLAAKRVLRYLKSRPQGTLTFLPNSHSLICFTDADWASDSTDRKSYSGFALFLGENLIAWESKKQKVVSLSTMEAEYIAMCSGAKEVTFHRSLLQEMGFNEYTKKPTTIMCDNQSAQFLVKNPIVHQRSKHIDIRYHYLRDKYHGNELNIEYVPSEDNVADILTKNLPKDRHEYLTGAMKLKF